ncbi:hypothetical protein J3D55_000458 [Chryseobacterium ginsenosidimutans]|uniref:DUF6705 family protein n=1 Tax=Chryseobacterium ginsenosidimutans TaxID=687846 RepID=UPI002166E44E|nr:DUF6705 family protein [Chryseobacterium ginsenosidimutans]MCS3867542.1 hypothetical protein [Chryseobacterium ginsenosidimutans]
MKNIILILFILFTISCKSQTYPLRTYTDIPDNSYLKDTNNELADYVGTWKANWNSKTIFIYISKEVNKYNSGLYVYIDSLIIKFKVTDIAGNILFDNTNLTGDYVKINGINFRNGENKYYFTYVDTDLCLRTGFVDISFTDSTKTQLKWHYGETENLIDSDCFYYNYPPNQRPEPLPYNAVFTKQ